MSLIFNFIELLFVNMNYFKKTILILMVCFFVISQSTHSFAKKSSFTSFLSTDGGISLDNLKNCINNDLANNFGNLCQRVFTFIDKNCDSKIPSPGLLNKKDKNLINEINNKILDLKRMINYQDLNSYVKEVINFSFNSNKYFNDEEPWKLKKTNTERMNTVLYCILNQIKSISILLYPIMPGSMKNTLNRLGVSENNINLNQVENFKLLKSGSIIIKGSILFEKIDSE